MTACLSHCSRGRLSSRVLVRARRVPDWCKTRRLGCPMPVWGRGSGCQVAGSQRGTARRGLFSSAAPAAGPSPPQRTCCFHFFPRTSRRCLLRCCCAAEADLGRVVRLPDLAYRARDHLRRFLRLGALLNPGLIRLALAPKGGGKAHLLSHFCAHILERRLARLRVVVSAVGALLDVLQQRRKNPVERLSCHSLHDPPHQGLELGQKVRVTPHSGACAAVVPGVQVR